MGICSDFSTKSLSLLSSLLRTVLPYSVWCQWLYTLSWMMETTRYVLHILIPRICHIILFGEKKKKKDLCRCDSDLEMKRSGWFIQKGKEKESEVAQLCPTLCDTMDCSLPGSSVHGIFLAIVLEWIAISFSRGIFPTQGSNPGLPHCRQRLYRIVDRRFTAWATREVLNPGLSRWALNLLTKETQVRSTDKRRQHGPKGRDWNKAAISQEFPIATKSWERQGTESPLETEQCCHVDFELLASKTVEKINFYFFI